jgi:mRNA-degrading endonuclease HigB of HigAB toxin-antitoxin module
MRQWADAIESETWRNPGDLKRTFASASFVGDLTIFNVGGNKYRTLRSCITAGRSSISRG